MPTVELPSGLLLNPISIRSVSKHAHFWGDKFYVRVCIRNESAIEVEQLSADDAQKLMQSIKRSVDESLSAADAYDDAYSTGRSDGYSHGRNAGYSEGYSAGFEEAKSAFWSYDREEYRINDYNLGLEAGKREGRSDAYDNGWENGYDYGQERLEEKLKEKSDYYESLLHVARENEKIWRMRAVEAEVVTAKQNTNMQGHAASDLKQYKMLKVSLAKLFHPDRASGSATDKKRREAMFKEVWAEIERIELMS